MRNINYLLSLVFLLLFISDSFGQYIGVIPQPLHVELKPDSGLVLKSYNIDPNQVETSTYHYLRNELMNKHHIFSYSDKQKAKDIQFSRQGLNAQSDEYYELSINSTGIHITAASEKGFFYGINTLLQLIDFAQLSKSKKIPYVEIKDAPRFVWRGLMLDESRHFFGKKKVKQILDWMAFYKLNKFHWHLTDEPGWRIEIKQYPFLSLIGGVGTYLNPLEAAQYYTQEDITEIVNYALARHIQIIPEIDMPGHATAANRAYPQFSGGGTQQHPDFTFHPAKASTYTYLTNILKEVNVLFPSNMLHLGGDEVAFGSDSWNIDPDIQKLKKEQKYTTNKEVETYFMRRMADSIYSLGSTLVVWDEMVDAGLPTTKTIQMWWRHDKPDQLSKSLQNGYPTVICPRIPFYFDFVQSNEHKYGRKWGSAFNSLDVLYNYDLSAIQKLEQYPNQVLGIQANLWTERIHNEQRLDFMLFPRLAALAELGWSQELQKDFTHFNSLLQQHLVLYNDDNIYFFDPYSNSHVEPKVLQSSKKYIDNPE